MGREGSGRSRELVPIGKDESEPEVEKGPRCHRRRSELSVVSHAHAFVGLGLGRWLHPQPQRDRDTASRSSATEEAATISSLRQICSEAGAVVHSPAAAHRRAT
jgi:hypothetical protein